MALLPEFKTAESRLQLIRRVPHFSGFSDSDLALLAQSSVPRVLRAGDTLFSDGTPADTFCLIGAGIVAQPAIEPRAAATPTKPSSAPSLMQRMLKIGDSGSMEAVGERKPDEARPRRSLGALSLIGTLPLLHRNERLRRRTTSIVAVTETVVLEFSYRLLDRITPECKDNFLEAVAEDALNIIVELNHPG